MYKREEGNVEQEVKSFIISGVTTLFINNQSESCRLLSVMKRYDHVLFFYVVYITITTSDCNRYFINAAAVATAAVAAITAAVHR